MLLTESQTPYQMIFFILIFGLAPLGSSESITRGMYNSISLMMTGEEYPQDWWEERAQCLEKLSPGVEDALELAWTGMVDYWATRGGIILPDEDDQWHQCEARREPCQQWFECNCTIQPYIPMDIWEPCDYSSNLAYDRLVLEICSQQQWSLPPNAITKLAEAFAIVTFGSAFFHGSDTHLGNQQDGRSNDLFPFILYQAGVSGLPENPIIHDLALEPGALSGEEIVDHMWEIYRTLPVEQWFDEFEKLEMPSLPKTFAGIFGTIMTLAFPDNFVDTIVPPLLNTFGVSPEDQEFFLSSFLPAMRNATEDTVISLEDKAKLTENTLATVLKLFYAFFWQEDVIDTGGANLPPETNAFGAALLPVINNYANSLTSWNLVVEDIQAGGGYPGSGWCNDLIPHAKWHVQSAASLADVALLMDQVYALLQSN